MALDYTSVYPGQLDPGNPAGYPFGEARNITVPGDGTGWPLERQWVNDLLGFEQSLLAEAGLTPNGNPDEVGNSQYLQALQTIIEQHPFTALTALDGTILGTLTVAAGGILEIEPGATLQCDGGAFFTGVATFSFPAAFTADFAAEGASFNGTVVCAGTDGGINALEVTGTSLFSAQVTTTAVLVAGAGIIVGAAGLIVTGASQFAGAVEFGDPVTLTGNAHVRVRVIVGDDNDTTYGINDADVVHVTTLSTDRVYTLSTAGAGTGSRITFVNEDTVDTLTAGGTALKNASGFPQSVTFVFFSGAWHRESISYLP